MQLRTIAGLKKAPSLKRSVPDVRRLRLGLQKGRDAICIRWSRLGTK